MIRRLLAWWQERRRLRQLVREGEAVFARRRAAAPRAASHSQTNVASRQQDGGSSTSAYARSRKDGWLPARESTSVAGRDIGGMVYVGVPPRLNIGEYRDKCRAYIDPSLPVAHTGTDKAGEDMPYWPGYSNISPQCRATYLDWLASGRSNTSYSLGYMFLYFYGLERRFFVDQSDADTHKIIDEVRRLRSLYPDNRSVRRYLGEFLDVAVLTTTDFEDIEPTLERHGWELPFSTKYAIGARIDRGKKLSSDWVLSWFMCHRDSKLRMPAKRCREEFSTLFRMRFDERFPDGLSVSPDPRKGLECTYRAASSEFVCTLDVAVNGKPVSDISGLRWPIEIAQEIANEAMADLDKFSLFLGRNPDGRGTVEAHALLPIELWPAFPSEGLEHLRSWADTILTDGGLVPLPDVIERLEGNRSSRITRRQLTSAADALARLGFGLAPDPRFALRSPKPDEPVVIFDVGEPVEKLEQVSAGYRNALMELALGSFVAHADEHIADTERRALEVQVTSADGINDQEKRRLRANLDWFLAVPPDMILLRRKLKEVDEDGQTALRAALITAAYADGKIQSEEVASLEKVYKALGLDPSLAYSDLHAGDVADAAPRTVRAAQPGPAGEPIPELDETFGIALDPSRIATILSDTERVSSVLGQIFDTGEDEEDTGVPKIQPGFTGLDQRHIALVLDSVKQKHWTEDAFEKLCERHALMPAGALEAVNEWAFGAYGEALLDDGYDVSPDVAGAVMEKLKGVGQ